jgi:geranylgeranyl pyrophosphate synthase
MAFGALAELGMGAAAAVKVLAARAGAGELLGGQAIDLQLQARGNAAPTSLEEVEHLHRGKTGALFAAACELGAIAGGADTATRAALGRYGMAIGVAFQHADDRDDAELTEHAAAAAARMRELCDEALTCVRPLGSPILDELARWIASRA